MSKSISLTATKRDELGSTASRRLRKQGFIPAVIYSAGVETISFQLDAAQAEQIEHYEDTLTIAIDGIGTKTAIVKDVQYKAINGQILSIDFQEVKA